MTDLVSLVLGIPNIVEGFVKTCRAIDDFGHVEDKHLNLIREVAACSKKLRIYSRLVDRSLLEKDRSKAMLTSELGQRDGWQMSGTGGDDPHITLRDSQKFLLELFQDCVAALEIAENVIGEWSARLKLNLEDRNHRRFFLANLALAFSDRMLRRTRMPSRTKKNSLSTFYGKTSFLVIGGRQIEDAMNRLNYSLQQLHDVLMISPLLRQDLMHSTGEPGVLDAKIEEDVLFIAVARDRTTPGKKIEEIDSQLTSSLRPLDERRPDSLMLVDSPGSPYHGCLIDRRNILRFLRKAKEGEALKDTELLARLFAEEHDQHGHDVSAYVGILPCCGFTLPSPMYHDLVFRIPGNSRMPRTLRRLLLERNPRHALDERLDFCRKLVSTVLIIHSLKIVHKDIRPDSIIVLSRLDDIVKSNGKLGEPYLVSFNVSRSIDSFTEPLVPSQYEEIRWASLYTHPRHHEGSKHLPFEMRDDIFSLGVCLLEIAMWTSLFVWDETARIYSNDTSVCDLSEERYDKILDDLGETMYRSPTWLRHADLVELAEREVAITMGNEFKDIVVSCLTFGMKRRPLAEVIRARDMGQNHFQNQSLAFIKHIVFKLRNLKLPSPTSLP